MGPLWYSGPMETVTPTNYLTHPNLSHLRSLPKDRQRRSPKMREICKTLANARVPLTRIQVMCDVHYRTRGAGAKFKPNSNRCYFRRMRDEQTKDAYGNAYHDEATYSVIINGLVRIAGKTKTGELLYELTDAGREFAQAQ